MPLGTAAIPICICIAAIWSAANMSGAACTRCSTSVAPQLCTMPWLPSQRSLLEAEVADLRACQVCGTVLLRMV